MRPGHSCATVRVSCRQPHTRTGGSPLAELPPLCPEQLVVAVTEARVADMQVWLTTKHLTIMCHSEKQGLNPVQVHEGHGWRSPSYGANPLLTFSVLCKLHRQSRNLIRLLGRSDADRLQRRPRLEERSHMGVLLGVR